MIFKDYQDELVGTYPDKNIYPDFFIKSNGEYVNMIGTVHGVSEIKIPKPKDGKKGPKGDQGPQGGRGPEGPRGKHGEELVQEDVVNNRNSTCISRGGISISRMCKGPQGDSPSAPPDGTHGQRCPHDGGTWTEENGRQVYRGGKCPEGIDGDPGDTCEEKYGIIAGKCPMQQHMGGPPGFTCEKVNRDAGIVVGPDANDVMRKCPPGDKGYPGFTCAEVNADIEIGRDINGVKTICPVQPNGNKGPSCYEVFKNQGLPECIESTPGVNSVDCINPDTISVKTCGVINPDKPSDVANNLSINGYNNGNTLTINNNKAITFRGNKITLPTDGNIVLKDANNNTIKTINKSYIDTMILKSQQCKKCPDRDGKKWWNNSTKCQEDQGECEECKECESGEKVEQECSEHSNTQCIQCDPGYVGIGCEIKCDPIKGEIPRDDKTACKTIGSNNYIDPDDNTKEKSIPYNKYRNPNDARLLKDIPSNRYRDPDSNTLNDCPSTSCPTGQRSIGSCGGGTSNSRRCTANVCRCDNGTAVTGTACNTHNKHSCASCSSAYRLKALPHPDTHTSTCQPYIILWDFNNQRDGGDSDWGGGSKEAIGHEEWIGSAINDDISSISNPHGHWFSLYEHRDYAGGCFHFNSSVPALKWTDNEGSWQYNFINTDKPVNDKVSSYKIGSWCP